MPGFLNTIVRDEQINDLFGMIHGILPPLEGCLQKRLDPLGMVFDLTLGGEQAVAVKINPIGLGEMMTGSMLFCNNCQGSLVV